MLTFKEYAAKEGVSYEAIRKFVTNNKDTLDGHIIKKNNTQYIDDEGVELLDKLRQENHIVIFTQEKSLRIEALEAEVDRLKQEREHAQDKYISLLDKNASLMEIKGQYDRLLPDLERAEGELSSAQAKIEEQRDELADLKVQLKILEYENNRLTEEKRLAEEEAASYTRSIFGLFRKRK